MTTSADARPLGILRRSWLLSILFLLAVSVAVAIWLTCRPSAPPSPPAVPVDPNDPDVAAFIEKSRQRVLQEPRSAQAWGTLGQAFLANDMQAESRLCFVEAERLDPSNPRWPYYQAVLLLERGEHESTLPYLQRAAARCDLAEPDNPVPRLLLAETLLAEGQREEAEEQLHHVAARQPDDPRAHFDLALAASARQDWPSSRCHLLRCLTSPLARQKASVQLAAVCQRLDDPVEAEKYRRQADRMPADGDWIDPFETEYLRWAVTKKGRYRLAESLEDAGRLPEALAVLQPMLEQYPDDFLRLTVGKLLSRMGENRRAEAMLREAVRRAPDKAKAHYYLSLALFAEAEDCTRRGDAKDAADKLYREVAASARQALAIKPDFGFACLPLGLSLKRLGQRAEALAALRRAVHCNPESAESHFRLGEMLIEENHLGEAKEQLEQTVRLSPPDASWLPASRAHLAAIRTKTTPKNSLGNPND
jgi:tetratricopeptide (TPR) repeat protein